jgi:hypothetical protein
VGCLSQETHTAAAINGQLRRLGTEKRRVTTLGNVLLAKENVPKHALKIQAALSSEWLFPST